MNSRELVGGLARVGELVAVTAIIVIVTGAAMVARPHALSGASANRSPDQLKAGAADALEQATRAGGSGYTFTVVSRSTLQARADGPLIEVPDPLDPHTSLGLAESYELGGSIASGYVTPDGYTLQMRVGPATATDEPDFEKAERTLAALVDGGKSWRDDGSGWYETDAVPGIGLDVRTISRLPTLLRDATGARAAPPVDVDGRELVAIEAEGRLADAPGLMAVDAEPFTELAGPFTFAFDDQGRLVRLQARMRNTNSLTFDLFVDTTLTFAYDGVPAALPAPEPRLVEPPTDQPADDPATPEG